MARFPLYEKIALFFRRIRHIGFTQDMDSSTVRRLGIFNLLNFFGLLTGIVIPVLAFLSDGYLPPVAWIVAISPAFISLGVLVSNYYRKYTFALLWYFILYPLVTALVYINSIDVGIELFFILYAVFAVFFLQDQRYIFPAMSICLICYFAVYVIKHEYKYVIAEINYPFYIFNHVLSVVLIFTGLLLIKKENRDYQTEILESNRELNRYNQEIEKQRIQLTELNNQKTKLFSVISHDVRTPLYALRNLFKMVQDYDLPAEHVKAYVPDVVKDLQYTTDLMENLLQWSKSQMKGEALSLQVFELDELVTRIQNLTRCQADVKQVSVTVTTPQPVYLYADKEMIEVAIRNLVSNAIKFTPANGSVTINVQEQQEEVTVAITDTGVGMSEEVISKLFGAEYYSTKGTAQEHGSGLGLRICRDFVQKNEGTLQIFSEPGKGSTFLLTFPKA